MVFGDKAVVEVIIFDLEENGLSVYVVPTLQEVHGFGGDEHTVAIDVLHGYEAARGERRTWDAELLHGGARPSLDARRGKGLLRSLGSGAKAYPGFPVTTIVHVCGFIPLGLICKFVLGRTWPQELL